MSLVSVSMPNNGWQPRDYQRKAWQALSGGIKRALLCWHRRAGKDDFCLHWAATQMVQRTGNYWHMLPKYAQARLAIWEAVNPHTGLRRIDEAFPKELRTRTNSQNMTIEFVNGATWRLVGSDNYNKLVGAPPVGITASEYALADPRCWAYLRPILRENGGWAAFISTPRGRNHFYRMFAEAEQDPDWFVQRLTVGDTHLLGAEALAKERAEYVREYGEDDGDSFFRQEYYCDFDAALVGTYFAKAISQAQEGGRITSVPYDPRLLVHTSWDLGMDDDTAIWFWQVSGQQVRVIDYLHARYTQLSEYASLLRAKSYAYGDHNLPHDVQITDISATGGMSRKDTLEALGLRVQVVPRVSAKADAINAIRNVLPRCVFDATKCKAGLDSLAQYRRAWDHERKVFADKPLHDWTSHGVDAFDGMARSINSLASTQNDWHKPLKYKSLGYA